jgi:hypothetical protein
MTWWKRVLVIVPYAIRLFTCLPELQKEVPKALRAIRKWGLTNAKAFKDGDLSRSEQIEIGKELSEEVLPQVDKVMKVVMKIIGKEVDSDIE